MHNTVAEVHEPSSHNEHGGGQNPLLKLDPGMAIWTWVVFFLLLIVLGKFGWRPILASLKDREDRIKKSLDDADKAREEMEKLSEKQKEMIQEAEDRAAQILQKSREQAQNSAVDIQNSARKEAQNMVESARRAIKDEHKKALEELKSETAGLAIAAATKLIKENMDSARNRKLVDAYIEDISKQE